MNMGRDAKGFTLIELLIVVAIMAILASIAYPSYQDQIIRSRRAEGRGLLLETAQALEKCKSLYGVYNPTDASGNNMCSVVDDVTGGSSISSTEGFYQVSDSGRVNATTFGLQAIPVRTDPKCGTLTIDETGTRGQADTGTVKDCW